MKKSLYIILVSTLLLGSCATYKKYERPNVKTSELFRDTANENSFLASTDTVSLGSMPWRQVFTDANLQQLIDSGLKNNTDLLTATLSVTQAKAMLQAAKLAFYPSFVFAPSGTAALWNFDKGASSYSMPIEANWTVDLFGSLTNAKRAQQVALLQSQDYQRAVQSGIIANIANAYYTLLMLDKQMEITKNTEQLTKQTYDMMVQQKQYSAGVDESAVQSAKANYYSVLASIPELERQIRSTENSLSILLGEAPRHILRSKLEDQSLPSNLVPVWASNF